MDYCFDIDYETRKHLTIVTDTLIERFGESMEEDAAQSSTTGTVPPAMEDPLVRAQATYALITTHYINPLFATIELVKELFSSHDILFRLYDIGSSNHRFSRTTLCWVVNNEQYLFDFSFEPNESSSCFYGLAQINACGEPMRGDILYGTENSLTNKQPLPAWFVSGLAKNS
jgi:hypothetical protein